MPKTSLFRNKLFTLLIMISFNVRSQEENLTVTNFSITSNIQSPNSASLGAYGNIPVSLYTGTADVSIPIYQINEGKIPLDISLHHDASGVRVNSVPGWVGQNWSLQAGGLIERSVKGRSADEFDVTRGNNNFNSLKNLNFNHWDVYDNIDLGVDPEAVVFWPWWNQGYKYNTSILSLSNWSSSENLFSIYSASRSTYITPGTFEGHDRLTHALLDVEYLKTYQPDLEPDIFTFNFMGHTGKFFLGQDGQWKVASSSNFKVICDFNLDVVTPLSTPLLNCEYGTTREYTEFPRVINKITMVDDNGNHFIFGYNDATELTFIGISTPVISSAWYLKYVKDKFGNIIYEFEYDKGPYIGHHYLNYDSLFLEDSYSSYPGWYKDKGVYSNYTEANVYGVGMPSYSASRIPIGTGNQMILPIYLKKIKTKSGLNVEINSSISNAMKFKISDNVFLNPFFYNEGYRFPNDPCEDYLYKRLPDFTTLNPEWNAANDYLSLLKWKKLDNITIKDPNANNLLTADFNYINQPTRRLFLTDLSINTAKKYTFEYDRDDLLPNFLSTATDHLGYFKGTGYSFPVNTTSKSFWAAFYNQRLTNPQTVKYGSLKKITYPTKGFTEFEYEPHNYSKEIDKDGNLINSSTEGVIGGLRIKKITNNDGFGNNYVKEYKYTLGVNSSVSSGHFLYKPVYFQEVDFKILNGGQRSRMAMLASTNPLIPMVNLFGNTIEYETVIEKESYFNSISNVSASNSGYNIYKYSNYSQFPNLAPVNSTVPDYNFKFPKTDKSFERGKLLEKAVYDSTDNLKEKTAYKYESNPDLKVNAINVVIVDASYTAYGAYNWDFLNERTMGAYQIYYGDKYLIEEKRESFNAFGVLGDTKKYTYQRYPESAGTILNGGDLFKRSEFQQTHSGGILKTYSYPFDYTNSISNKMYASRIIPPINEKKEILVGDVATPSKRTLISEQKTDYIEIQNNIGALIQVPQSVLSKKGSNNFEAIFKYLKYDNDGNLQEYKTENDITNCLIWGYNQSQVVAKIENATSSEVEPYIADIQNLSNGTNEQLLITELNKLRTNLPKAMVTTYTYKPLFGVSTITDPKGYKTTYLYDNAGRLEFVKDAEGNIISENKYYYKN